MKGKHTRLVVQQSLSNQLYVSLLRMHNKLRKIKSNQWSKLRCQCSAHVSLVPSFSISQGLFFLSFLLESISQGFDIELLSGKTKEKEYSYVQISTRSPMTSPKKKKYKKNDCSCGRYENLFLNILFPSQSMTWSQNKDFIYLFLVQDKKFKLENPILLHCYIKLQRMRLEKNTEMFKACNSLTINKFQVIFLCQIYSDRQSHLIFITNTNESILSTSQGILVYMYNYALFCFINRALINKTWEAIPTFYTQRKTYKVLVGQEYMVQERGSQKMKTHIQAKRILKYKNNSYLFRQKWNLNPRLFFCS